jgi:hypothetical protein
MTFTTAQTADADGIKTSVATATTAQNYSGAALNGALVTSNVAYPRFASKLGIASYPTVTSSSVVGAYTAASTIVFTGTYNGVAVTRTATLTQANGNETQFADGPMDSVTSIAVAAQADTDGAFTFGFSGLCPAGDGAGTAAGTVGRIRQWWVSAASTGNVHVGYSDGSDDTVPLIAGQMLEAYPVRIYADTAVTVTVYE